jgi:hypothetical protein
MKPEDIQHGGDHYKGQPKHLQPIYLGMALKLNPIEYSILKYLLRHRKKGGLLDLQKMMHFGQMLIQEEHGVETEIKYLSEPIDAEFEVVPESQSITSDNPQESPACRFKVHDVIQHREDVRDRSEMKWRVTGETAKSLQVVSVDPYQTPSFIERQCWHRYTKVEQPAAEPTELPACPFKAGDIIRGIGEPNTSKWKVERVRSDRIDVITYDVHKHPAYVEYNKWQNYIRVDPIDGTAVDKPTATC